MDRARCFLAFGCFLVVPLISVAQTAPQFSLVDLGLIGYAGTGINAGTDWGVVAQPGQEGIPQSSWASFGGPAPTNEIYAEFTNYPTPRAVGFSTIPSSGSGNPAHHAAYWPTPTAIVDIGTLPGAVAQPGQAGPESVAYYMNGGNGDVVGVSDTAYPDPTGTRHAIHGFLWRNGVLQDIGTLSDNQHDSTPYALNDSDEIVGTAQAISSVDGSVLQRAFLYAGGHMYNLTFDLVNAPTTIRLTTAVGISCQGNISAIGYDTRFGAQFQHSYVLVRQGPARNCPD